MRENIWNVLFQPGLNRAMSDAIVGALQEKEGKANFLELLTELPKELNFDSIALLVYSEQGAGIRGVRRGSYCLLVLTSSNDATQHRATGILGQIGEGVTWDVFAKEFQHRLGYVPTLMAMANEKAIETQTIEQGMESKIGFVLTFG